MNAVFRDTNSTYHGYVGCSVQNGIPLPPRVVLYQGNAYLFFAVVGETAIYDRVTFQYA